MSISLVHGIHAVARCIEQSPGRCLELFCTEKPNPRLLKLIDQARAADIAVHSETRAELTARCGTDKHQGCVLLTREAGKTVDLVQCLETISDNSLLLVLDGVQDPHNLGACLRTADAAGVDAVVIPRHGAAGLGPTVSKVAAGAAESVPFAAVSNTGKTLDWIREYGVSIVGTSDAGDKSIFDCDLAGSVALVMGREHSGLRQHIAGRCDVLASLPMSGAVSSLNVSVAAGICLYEVVRQRRPEGLN